MTTTSDSGLGSLRQVMLDAVGGETINFAAGVLGTITLTSGQMELKKPLTITGPGAAKLSISGNNNSRVLEISARNGVVMISGLTIRNGRVEAPFEPSGTAQDALGGGILCPGGAKVGFSECVISDNLVIGGASGGSAGNGFGGGFYGIAAFTNCVVANNVAIGGAGVGGPGNGSGGGLAGGVILVGCTIARNTARGTPDTSGSDTGGRGLGGGIYNTGQSILTNCDVTGNLAQGGEGDNVTGGEGYGGGIHDSQGSLKLDSTNISANAARGGNGREGNDDGAAARGGGIYAGPGNYGLQMDRCLVSSNSAISGVGQAPRGFGGESAGGGIYSGSSLGDFGLSNSTVTSNRSEGGKGGNAEISGDDHPGVGGGIYSRATLSIINSTISHNLATGGPASGSGNQGGGIFHTFDTASMTGALVAMNVGVGSTSPDVRGKFTSSRFNLIGEGSSSLTGITNGVDGNRVGRSGTPVDPKLGPLQDNGGSTHTRALLLGSPAVDAGIASAAATDQRGFMRPYNQPSVTDAAGSDGSDIGAFETGPATTPALRRCKTINFTTRTI